MDRQAARDFLYGFGRDRYRLASLAATGTQGELRYGGLASDTPANGIYWARLVVRTTYQGQETLRGADMKRRFLTEGLFFVQLFCPTGDEAGLNPIDQIAEQLLTDFRTYQAPEIEFTSAQTNDTVAPEPNWVRANVIATFQYRQFL